MVDDNTYHNRRKASPATPVGASQYPSSQTPPTYVPEFVPAKSGTTYIGGPAAALPAADTTITNTTITP